MYVEKRLLLVISFILSIFLAACNDETESPKEGNSNSSEPQYGGELVRALIYGDPQNLDPVAASHSAATTMITMNIFEPLVRYDAVNGEIKSGNAEKWEVSEDGKTYTFTLKKGVKFHNGREVTAQDFKYSLERLADPNVASPNAANIQNIVGYEDFQNGAEELSGVQVVNDYTLQITVEKADSTFLTTLSFPYAAAVPQEEVERLGDRFGAEPIGAGPFKIAGWVRDSEIELEANEDYIYGRPYLDKVIYKVVTDQAARDAAFMSAQLDVMVLGDAQYAQYTSNERYKDYIVEVPELYIRALRFNQHAEGPWQDVRVRQAINYAIDNETIINNVLGGKAYAATGVLPTSIKGYNENLTAYEYNPENAKQLLAEAGYPEGFTLPILASSHSAFGVPAVEAAIGYLEEVGIHVEIEQAELATVIERMVNGEFDTAMMSLGGMTDAVNFLTQYFHTKNFGGSGNAGFYENAEVDALLDKALASTDETEVIELVQKAEQMIVDEAPMWFFNYNKAVVVHQPWVKGLQAVPTDIDFQDLTKVWIDETAK